MEQNSRVSGVLQVLQYTAEQTKELANANSVVGEIIQADGVTIIPVSKLSVGFAGGGADLSNAKERKRNSPAGAGAKVTRTPMNFIVIKDGDARLITVADGDEGGSMVSKLVEQAKGLFSKK